jgi:hypothetical protein
MTPSSHGRASRAALPLALFLLAAPLAAQQPAPARHPETLRGRVTTDSGAPIPGAVVNVTMGPDRVVKTDTARADGRWSVAFPDGTGDYLVHVAAPNRIALRKRVTRAADTDSVYTIDAALKSSVQQLSAVRVQARKPKPERRGSSELGAGVGESERDVEGVYGALTPDQQGDLAAMAATTPGILAGPNGISAFGLAGQNAVTLGGLAFSGSDLPRDVRTNTRVVSSTYDPALGWFGGARVAMELATGGLFSSRRAHLTLDAPALQYTDAVGARLGQRSTSLQGSAGGEGPFHDDRLGYAWGAQVSRRTQPAPSLLDAAPDALRAAGVSPDSTARLVSLLGRAGIPLSTEIGGVDRASDVVSLIGKVTRQSYDYAKGTDIRRTWGVTGYAKWNRTDALGVGPTATPARGGEARGGNAGVQAVYSGYVGKQDWLMELRTGLSGTDDRRTPYLALPGAVVQVGAPAALGATDFAPALTALAFGGNGALDTRRRTATWESQGELRLYPPKRTRHRVSVATDVRFDALRDDPAGDRLGTFSYASLDDLAAGRPASFSRTLQAPSARAGVWNGFLALGDYWRPSDKVQLMYGVRAEADRFATRPAYNPALDAALGLRTDAVPNTVHLSPRLGLTWRRRPGGQGFTVSPLGIMGFGSGSVLRAGVGEFRSLLGPELVAPSTAATGLPGATQRLLCVGSAVPAAAWSAWAAGDLSMIPSTCANGAGPLTDAAPSVRVIDPRYTAPRSWRGNLAYASSWKGAQYSVEGIGSYNVNQPGFVDANFAGTSRFTLAGEGRPVYVSPAAIDPASGALSSAESRRAASFGRVAVQRADLRSLSRQLTVTLVPSFDHFGRWFVSGAYTLASVRQLAGGFDGTTFGDPRERRWARGDLDARHQVLLQGGYNRWGFTVTAFARLTSGLPFTPTVGGDVNGDGYANDRAFVFDPAAPTTDPALGAQLRALLTSAPPHVRECLSRALGGAAARNGCEGPWTSSLTMRVNATGTRLKLGRRANVALSLSNPLGALDQLVHGDDLRGWGTPAFPDATLYQVRGFDPTRGQFRYAVNPRFGDTRPTATSLRVPFRATLDVQLDVGRPIGQQQLDKWLRPGRAGHPGTRLSATDLQKRYRCNVPDPYAGILQESDSLLLTRPQIEALQAAREGLRTRLDSVWLDLATYLDGLGDRYDGAAALKRQETTTDSAWVIAQRHVATTVPGILSPVQRRLTPYPAQMMLTATKPITGIRMFSANCNR